MVSVSIPWATVGTSPCRHCSFSVHTDMLGRTTVGWVGHRCVSSHGHKWSFCFMSTAYKLAAFQQLYSVLASSFLALCEWTQSDSVWPVQLMRKHINSCATKSAHLYQHVCHFMYMHQKETYQLMCHEKCTAFQPYVTSCTWTISKHVNSCTTKMCTAYQHVCHFPYMNQKETYQLMCHEKCTVYQNVCHFMYMNHKQTYQLMYHEKCTVYQHVCHFMYKNHKETYQLMYRETCTAYQHECHFNEDEQHFGDPLHPFILWFGQLFSIWPQFLNLAIRTFGGRNFHTGKAFCQDWPCFAHHCREK